MGLNVAWLAVQNLDRPALMDRLNLEEIGEASDDLINGLLCGLLPDGRRVKFDVE